MINPIRDDAQARRILFDTYWSSAGWRPDQERAIAPSDFELAKAAGYMFEPRAASHDEWIRLAIEAARKVTIEEAASGFVASLSSKRLATRSALGSLATLRHLQPHPYRPWPASCAECGLNANGRPEDLNLLSFERHKWGGIRHGNPIYAWFDLDIFDQSERVAESSADTKILNQILNAARQAPPDSHARDLERMIAKVVPSSKSERDILLGILALAGVLAPPNHLGLLTAWVPFTERQPPPKPSKIEWLYPMFWWRGSVGVNEHAARSIFGDRIE